MISNSAAVDDDDDKWWLEIILINSLKSTVFVDRKSHLDGYGNKIKLIGTKFSVDKMWVF